MAAQNHYSGKDRTERLALGLSASFLSALAVWLNTEYFSADIGKEDLEAEYNIYLLLIGLFYEKFFFVFRILLSRIFLFNAFYIKHDFYAWIICYNMNYSYQSTVNFWSFNCVSAEPVTGHV